MGTEFNDSQHNLELKIFARPVITWTMFAITLGMLACTIFGFVLLFNYLCVDFIILASICVLSVVGCIYMILFYCATWMIFDENGVTEQCIFVKRRKKHYCKLENIASIRFVKGGDGWISGLDCDDKTLFTIENARGNLLALQSFFPDELFADLY